MKTIKDSITGWIHLIFSEAPFFFIPLFMLIYFYIARCSTGLSGGSAWKMIFPLSFFYFFPRLLDVNLAPHLGKMNPRPFSFTLMVFAFLLASFTLGVFTFPFLAVTAFLLWRRTKPPLVRSDLSKWDRVLIILSLGSLFFFIAATTWHEGYLSPFFLEKLKAGLGKSDSLSHISYSLMLEKYQTMTVGLHGFSSIRYHLGVHTFLIALGKSLGENLIFCFNVGYPILIPALLLQALWSFGQSFSSSAYRVPALVLLAALIIQVFPQGKLDQFALYPSFFISESYAMSLLLMTYFVWALVEFLRDEDKNHFFALAMMPLFLGWIVFTKVSTGFLCAATLGLYTLYDFKRGKRLHHTLLLFLGAVVALPAYHWSAKNYPNPYLWNYFIHSYGSNSSLFYFYFYYHFWTALEFALLVFYLNRRSSEQRSRPFSFLVLSMLFCAVITWPSIHFQIDGGSGYYFLNLTMWFALFVIFAAFSSLKKFSYPLAIFALILAYPNIKSATGSLRNLIYEGEFAANSHDADSDVYRAFFDELVKIKTEVPKDYLIYIPQSETGYWFKKDYGLAPMSLGILVLSEHPAIFGIPRNSEIKESGSFRFWTGAIPEYWTYPENPTFEQICIEAKKSSFHHYLELNWSSTEHRVTRQEHECP